MVECARAEEQIVRQEALRDDKSRGRPKPLLSAILRHRASSYRAYMRRHDLEKMKWEWRSWKYVMKRRKRSSGKEESGAIRTSIQSIISASHLICSGDSPCHQGFRNTKLPL